MRYCSSAMRLPSLQYGDDFLRLNQIHHPRDFNLRSPAQVFRGTLPVAAGGLRIMVDTQVQAVIRA